MANKVICIASYVGHGKMLNAVIRFWDKTDISHTELGLNCVGEDVWECWSASFMDGGVRQKYLDLSTPSWCVIELPVSDEEHEYATRFVNEAKAKNIKYDLLAIFANGIGRPIQDRKKMFCNEFVGAALQIREPHRYRPASFHNLMLRIAHERREWRVPRRALVMEWHGKAYGGTE